MLHVHDIEMLVKQRLRPRLPGAHNIRRRVLTIFLLETHSQRTPLASIACSVLGARNSRGSMNPIQGREVLPLFDP